MTKAKKLHPYYSYKKLWSYNAVFNFLVGGRGLGKTYGAKLAAIKANIKTGEEFVYLRRFKTEMIPAKQTFFADIESEFPDWDFRVQGVEAQRAHISTRDEKKRPWITMGRFATLSTSQTQKSLAFPKVTLIIFDEFIIELGNTQYLRDEANVFQNFYNTVDRYQDKTRVLFLANSVSIMNPYFIKYEIRPDKLPEYSTSHDGFILCHFPDSKQFEKSVYETRFGRFIQNSDYADYAVGNNFEDANSSLISDKSAKAKYRYTLETSQGTYAVWQDTSTNMWYLTEKRPRSNEIMFTMVASKMTDEKVLLTYQDKLTQSLRGAFRRGAVVFDKPGTRNGFVEVFKR